MYVTLVTFFFSRSPISVSPTPEPRSHRPSRSPLHLVSREVRFAPHTTQVGHERDTTGTTSEVRPGVPAKVEEPELDYPIPWESKTIKTMVDLVFVL